MVKVRIGREEIVYSDEDLSEMTREQLKQLKQDLQCNIEEVSAKRARYQAENDEEYNSKNYFKQIAKYKTAMACLRRSLAKVNMYDRNEKESDQKEKEHWLWRFYIEAKSELDEKDFKKLVELTDESVKYHAEIGE